jgi:hypothetical protein
LTIPFQTSFCSVPGSTGGGAQVSTTAPSAARTRAISTLTGAWSFTR